MNETDTARPTTEAVIAALAPEPHPEGGWTPGYTEP